MECNEKHRGDERLHSLEAANAEVRIAVFGKPGEKGLAHIVRDNTVLIDAHIRECREAREEQRQQAYEAKRESRRQFWGIIGAIIASLVTAFLLKWIG